MHETNGEKHSEGSFKITREMKNITCFCVLILFLGKVLSMGPKRLVLTLAIRN